MSKLERCLIVVIFLIISIFAVIFIGAEYYDALSAIQLVIGVLIGMVLFIPNNDGGY